MKKILENIADYDQQSTDKQNYYDLLLKFSIAYHRSKISSKSAEALKQQYNDSQNLNLILDFINTNSSIFKENEKRFVDLDWRLEAKVASRSSRELDNFNTKILLNMKTVKGHEPENIYLEMTPSNLTHVISKLEQALINSKNIIGK